MTQKEMMSDAARLLGTKGGQATKRIHGVKMFQKAGNKFLKKYGRKKYVEMANKRWGN